MSNYTVLLPLIVLGAFHGLNPGMGWLFAVMRGLQEQRRAAVVRALGPIALGHAASVGLVVALVALARDWIDLGALEVFAAILLITFGLFKWLRPLSHPRWVGMRVRGRELAAWSFLMATAHGAGLMLVPFVLQLQSDDAVQSAHAAHLGHASDAGHATHSVAAASRFEDLMSVGVHSLAMFAAMALIAVLVYDRFGVAILRRSWFNLDRVWAGALVGAGLLTLVL